MAYLCHTTVLDKSWKGTTEQWILHFNEQFRQLDEVSPPEESLPYTTQLTLFQTAVHNIPELRMVETMEEIISLSSSTLDLPWNMTTTSLYSKMLASDMIAISNLDPLQPLELPTSMNYLMTLMTTHIPRTTTPQVPPMVALICQERNSTRSILPTSIGLLMTPPLPIRNLPLADSPPEGLLDPSFFLPTSTNFGMMWPSRSSKSTMPPPDPTLPPKGLLIPMTQTLPSSIHPLTLPQVIQPPRFPCRP